MPSVDMAASSPFVAAALRRPRHYYARLITLAPAYALAVLPRLGVRSSPHYAFLWAWALGFIGGMTALGCFGAGFQTRFLLPAALPLAILAASATQR